MAVERFLNYAEETFNREGLGEEREAFGAHEALHHIGVVEAGNEENRKVGLAGAQTFG